MGQNGNKKFHIPRHPGMPTPPGRGDPSTGGVELGIEAGVDGPGVGTDGGIEPAEPGVGHDRPARPGFEPDGVGPTAPCPEAGIWAAATDPFGSGPPSGNAFPPSAGHPPSSEEEALPVSSEPSLRLSFASLSSSSSGSQAENVFLLVDDPDGVDLEAANPVSTVPRKAGGFGVLGTNGDLGGLETNGAAGIPGIWPAWFKSRFLIQS